MVRNLTPVATEEEELEAVVDKMLLEGGADLMPEVDNDARALYEEAKAEGLMDAAAGVAPPAPIDIWTLDTMLSRGYTTGCIGGDRNKQFTFKPKLDSTYCKERFERAVKYDAKAEGITFYDVQLGYVEIVWLCIKGGSWGLRETEQDDEGNDLFDDNGVIISHPLKVTLDNVKLMSFDQLRAFIEAMFEAIRGEVSTQD